MKSLEHISPVHKDLQRAEGSSQSREVIWAAMEGSWGLVGDVVIF